MELFSRNNSVTPSMDTRFTNIATDYTRLGIDDFMDETKLALRFVAAPVEHAIQDVLSGPFRVTHYKRSEHLLHISLRYSMTRDVLVKDSFKDTLIVAPDAEAALLRPELVAEEEIFVCAFHRLVLIRFLLACKPDLSFGTAHHVRACCCSVCDSSFAVSLGAELIGLHDPGLDSFLPLGVRHDRDHVSVVTGWQHGRSGHASAKDQEQKAEHCNFHDTPCGLVMVPNAIHQR